MVVNVFLGAIAENHPELLVLMTRVIGQQPLQHRAERCDAGTGRDKNGIAQRRTQDEVAERPLSANFLTFIHVAKKIRHETILYAVQAERETVVISRRGSDGVSAGDLFAVGLISSKGKPLPGNKTEAGLARHLELKMLGLLG